MFGLCHQTHLYYLSVFRHARFFDTIFSLPDTLTVSAQKGNQKVVLYGPCAQKVKN